MAYSDDPDHELDTIEWEAYMEASGRWYEGDARRCPHHPHIETSSPDGMFDAPCSECEAAMYDDYPHGVIPPAAPLVEHTQPDDPSPHGPAEIDNDDIPF